MRKTLLFMAAIMAMTAGAVSCAKDDTPEKEKTQVADVYFSAENGDYCYYVGPGEANASAELILFRENSTIADSYQIEVVSQSDGIEIPSSVSFAEGETTASIIVKAPSSAKAGDVLSFELLLKGDNVNSSANSVDGTLRCEGTFYYYQEFYGAAQIFTYSSMIAYPYMGDMLMKVWKLDSKNWVIKDFLGGGGDLKIILDDDNTISSFVYSLHDLYPVLDSYGFYMYYFYDEATDEYDDFQPKGEERGIYPLTLYSDPLYSGYNTQYKYFYLTIPTCTMYYYDENGEEVDKDFEWQYLYIYLYDNPEMNGDSYDFENYPELEVVDYPEPVYSEDVVDGKVPLQFWLDQEEIYLDTQYATVVDGTYVIDNFMATGQKVVIVPDGETFSFEVYGTDGNKLELTTDEYGFIDLGMEYIFPWVNNYSWCIYGLSQYNDPYYTTWDEENREAWFWASYYVYDGAAFRDITNNYVGIYF